MGSLEEAAPVSALTATSVNGGVPPASAVAQGDAAKHDLSDDDGDALFLLCFSLFYIHLPLFSNAQSCTPPWVGQCTAYT